MTYIPGAFGLIAPSSPPGVYGNRFIGSVDEKDMACEPIRCSVADLLRLAQVSQTAHNRDLNALAVVSDTTPLNQFVDDRCRPAERKGKRVRALNSWSAEDHPLLEDISRES